MSWITVRLPWASFRVDRRAPIVIGGLLIALVAVAALNISLGSFRISIEDIIRTLINPQNSDQAFVINELRMPRTVLSVLVGMSLATSGAILQGLTGNDLAAPEIIGVEAGASVTVVAAIILFPEISVSLYPLAAMAGGFITSAVVYLLAWREGVSPMRLILVGIAVGAVANAIYSLLIALGETRSVMGAFAWLAGSVNDTTWKHIFSLLPWMLVFLPMTWILSRQLNLFTMGDEIATGLGVHVGAARLALIAASVALAGAAISVSGTIGFVGLMAPHFARRLVGPSHEGLLPASALTGGLIVLASDTVGRNLFALVIIPVGIVTAIVGVPFFIYLLYSHRNQW